MVKEQILTGQEGIHGQVIYADYKSLQPDAALFKSLCPSKIKRAAKAALFILVGVSGFEPEASWTRTKRDTKLRHTPILKAL